MILLQLIALKLKLNDVSSHFQLMLIIYLLFQSILELLQELGTTKYAPTPNLAHISAIQRSNPDRNPLVRTLDLS